MRTQERRRRALMDRQGSTDYFEVRRTSALMERPLLAQSKLSTSVKCERMECTIANLRSQTAPARFPPLDAGRRIRRAVPQEAGIRNPSQKRTVHKKSTMRPKRPSLTRSIQALDISEIRA